MKTIVRLLNELRAKRGMRGERRRALARATAAAYHAALNGCR